MTSITRLLLLLIAASIAGMSLMIEMSGCRPARPNLEYPSVSDLTAIAFFQENQLKFEELRELLEKHPALMYFNPRQKTIFPPGIFAGKAAEQDTITRLMEELRLVAINGPASDWGMRMSFLIMDGTCKSFWFARTPPPNEQKADTTENLKLDSHESRSVFREIIPSWYLRLN